MNSHDNDGNTALHLSACRPNVKYIKKLLQAGIHINRTGSCHQNALKIIVDEAFDYKDSIMILYAAGETLDGIHEDDVPKELKFENEKLELKHICREAIRKHLLKLDPHQHLFFRIPKLELPSLITEYLLFNMSLDTDDDGDDDNTDDDDNSDGDDTDDDGKMAVILNKIKRLKQNLAILRRKN